MKNSEEKKVSRRGFLKIGATVGTAMCIPSMITTAMGANPISDKTNNLGNLPSSKVDLPMINTMRT